MSQQEVWYSFAIILELWSIATSYTCHKWYCSSYLGMFAMQTCVLLVHLRFKSDEDVSKFAETFKPMTHYVKEKEPGHTYAYKLLRSESDPLHLTIYERCFSYSLSQYQDFGLLLQILLTLLPTHLYSRVSRNLWHPQNAHLESMKVCAIEVLA